MPQGSFKTIDRQYGFIRPNDEGSPDVFCFWKELEDDWPDVSVGDRVSFDSEPSPRRPGKFQAINVRLLD